MTFAEQMSTAISNNDFEMVVKLISNGADVNERDLVRGGPDGNEVFGEHWPPLHIAIEFQRYEIAKLLIEAGVDVNRELDGGWTPLTHAIDIESDAASQSGLPAEEIATQLTELLLASGAKPTPRAFQTARAYGNHKAQAMLEYAQTFPPC